MVHTEAGLAPIERIKLGDKVFAQDPETGQQGYFEVVALHSHPTNEVLRVTVDGDDDSLPAEVMEITPGHPVYVEGRGWVKAEALTLGDRLRRADGGWARVLALERLVLDAPQVVYNLTVRGMHTYFVLEVGVLVHNCLPTSANGYSGPAEGFPNTMLDYDRRQIAMYGLRGTQTADLQELADLVRARAQTIADPFENIDMAPTLADLQNTGRIQTGVSYLYAIDLSGNIRLGHPRQMLIDHHSFLVKGQNVYGAGRIQFTHNPQGNLIVDYVNPLSGHYFGGQRAFGSKFRLYLQRLLETDGFQVRRWEF